MNISRIALGLGVCFLAGSPSHSHAALSYFNVGWYTDAGNSATVVAQGYTHSTYATAFSVNYLSGYRNNSGAYSAVPASGYTYSTPLPANHTDPFVSFCLDINVYIANGFWKSGGFSSVGPVDGTSGADRQEAGLYRAASLYAHYAPGILTASGNGSSYTWNDKARGAALQLAIWEVLYEKTGVYSLDAANGNGANSFYVSSVSQSIRNDANAMLSSQWNIEDHNLDTTFWNAAYANGSARGSQDLIGPISAVPEPTTIVAGVLLLLPFGLSTLRSIRNRSRSL